MRLIPFILVALSLPAKAPTIDNRVARLEGIVARLEGELEDLKQAVGRNPISEYTIDSAAGTIKCRSCKFLETK